MATPSSAIDGNETPKPPHAKQRKTRGKPNAVDIHVGARLRQRRVLMGMSQEKLGEALDLTFQQIQKYERGVNRIGAGRLYELARALDVPEGYFFEELPEEVTSGHYNKRFAPPEARLDSDTYAQRETIVMIRAYYSIQDPVVRRRMLELMRSMASEEIAGSEEPD